MTGCCVHSERTVCIHRRRSQRYSHEPDRRSKLPHTQQPAAVNNQ
eukprot:COSAG04_NODE_8050_length_1030_cov_0.952739_1_plen_44_part_10